VAAFGHVPGNRWDDLSPESGGGREAVLSADGYARELVSVRPVEFLCWAIQSARN